jgi:hypothetical protein
MMDWRYLLVVLGALINVCSAIPYLIAIVKGKTRPRIMSWFIWTVLTGMGAAAAISEHQWLTSILLIASAFETLTVVMLGWRHGNRHVEKLDVFCLVGVMVGIILWQIFNSPAIGALAAITLDLIGGVPTLVHAWKKPQEETWQTFFLCVIGSTLTLIALKDWRITSSAFPIYLVAINAFYTVVILARRKAHNRGV